MNGPNSVRRAACWRCGASARADRNLKPLHAAVHVLRAAAGQSGLTRYRMTRDEMLECARQAEHLATAPW